MTPKFKFLRRVRIHGGECGAVARALHHEVKGLSLYQADLGKASKSTIERKQMSTKTTLKRIALVAVSALGFGLLAAVSPAQATVRTATSLVVGDIPAVRVGETAYVPVKVYLPSGSAAGDTITITAKVTSAPILGGAVNAASVLGAKTDGAGNNTGGVFDLNTNAAGVDYSTGTKVEGRTATTAATYAGNTIGGDDSTDDGPMGAVVRNYPLVAADVSLGYHTTYVKITPDVAGSYSVMVSTNSGSLDGFTAGDPNVSFTIATGVAPTGVTLTNLGGGSTITGGSPNGVAVLVSLTGGSLAGDEGITLTPTGTGKLSKGASAAAAVPNTFSDAATAITLTKDDFISGKKVVWLTSAGTSAETVSLTATGTSGVASSVTATRTYSVVAGAGSTTKVLTLEAPGADAVYAMTNATESTDTITVTELSTSQKVGFTTAASMTAQKGYITVNDTEGTISGVASLRYDVSTSFAETSAASGGSFSFTASGVGKPAGTTLFTVTIPAATTTIMGLAAAKTKTFVTAARTNSAFSITPATTILAAPGAAIALTAALEDQFGVARANVSVTVTTSGRNNPASSTRVTNADGEVTFTTADTSTSTTALSDTITFSATGATSSSVTISYANTAVSTVTVTGGNTTASVTALTTTDKAISVGSSTTGAEAGAFAVTATVKDSLGNALAGVPVSFTVAGDGVAFLTSKATVYTGATGTAAGSLYAWKAGTYTYTVTAGGKTTTGTATFAQSNTASARVVSATVAGNVVTGKVVDRFGNPVSGVTLYAVTTSPANIGGAFSTSTATNAKGESSWVVSGSGSVTITAVNPSLPAGSTFGETCALAGNRTCATASTAAAAYSATVAGTATTAETFVGATFAPAGVASATVTVTNVDAAAEAANAATDAAAEAIDAANAATDAANLAAEAADAATVAAEEARDAADAATAAVEELATQVATLMAALKAQITTLANTVAKIAKKVKA